jgi:hypothetical protein
MNATALKKLDENSAAAIRDVATKNDEGAFHGFIPAETIAFFYEHAQKLAAEIVKPVVGFSPPEIIVSVDKENRRQLGHFKVGRDGLGLNWRISLNVLHLSRPKAAVIGTLLHEILHAVQQQDGKPGKGNFHNKEFVGWCEKVGLPTDSKGHDLGIAKDGVFAKYCEKHGLEGKVALVEKKILPKAGGSKLKKWSCDCGCNVRVAVEEFDATCNLCDSKFVKQDK